MNQFLICWQDAPISSPQREKMRNSLYQFPEEELQQEILADGGKLYGVLQSGRPQLQQHHSHLTWWESSRLLVVGQGWLEFSVEENYGEGTDFLSRFQQAYLRLGESFFKNLRGHFSLFLYDKRLRAAYVLRDPLGFYPLYYARTPRGIAVASHLKPLLKSGFLNPEISPEGLLTFLQFGFTLSPYTLIKGISRLFPGEFLKVTASGEIRKVRYWHMPASQPEEKPLSCWKEEIRQTMEAIIAGFISKTKHVAVFLSGGVDSAIVTGMLAQQKGVQLKAFTFGLDIPHPRLNYLADIPYARLVVEKFRLPYREVILNRQFPISTVIRQMLPYFEALQVSPNVVTKFYLMQEVRKEGISSVFTGSVAGAAFESYPPEKLVKKAGEKATPPEALYALKSRFLKLKEIHTLFPFLRAYSEQDVINMLAEYFSGIETGDLVDRVNLGRAAMQGAEKAVPVHLLAAFPHRMEIEMPFYHQQFLEIGSRIPRNLKIGSSTQERKFLLKTTFEDLLPEPIRSRKIIGFPGYYWNQGELAALQSQLFANEVLKEIPFLEVQPFHRIIEEERHSTKKSAGKRTWGLMLLVLWYFHFITQKDIDAF